MNHTTIKLGVTSLLFSGILLCFTSCSKEQTLTEKNLSLIEGEWTVTSYLDEGTDLIKDGSLSTFKMQYDKEFGFDWTGDKNGGVYHQRGTYSIFGTGNELNLRFVTPSEQKINFEITTLNQHDLIIERTANNHKYIIKAER